MSTLRVAVVQAAPVLFDLQASLDKVAQLSADAAATGAQLVLFPEAFLPAYPRGLGFGSVVGSRTKQGREDWLLYFQQSLSIPGSATQQLSTIAQTHQIYLIIGVTEIAQSGGSLYCTLLYIGPDGTLLHKHRKLKPTAAERIIWAEGRGDDLQVLPTPIGRVGGLICWENYMPLLRMTLYQQDIQIYLAPTADQRESWQATIRHIACEGRCFVLSCNQFVTKSMYPERFQAELSTQTDPLCRGGSAIISPLGDYIHAPLWDTEGILSADLDLDEVIRARLDFDPAGHYHREDVFDFHYRFREPG